MLVAARLFRQKSFLDTTLDDSAANADINKVTNYSYFKGKEQLLCAILTGALQKYVSSARPIFSTVRKQEGDKAPCK